MLTLALHDWRNTFPFELGLTITCDIPNARIMALDSRNNEVLSHEPDWERYMSEVTVLLSEDEQSGT